MTIRFRTAIALFVCSTALAYSHVLAGLVRVWAQNEDYSHGFIVAPLCGYFLWQRRRLFAEARPMPATGLGLLTVLAGVVLYAGGALAAEPFLQRVSLIVVLGGALLFVLGPRHLRIAAMPLAFALLMMPLPAIVFNRVTFPLQLLASRAAESALTLLGIPVLREGNVIVLANTTLEVAEACSGIRSLLSLLALGVAYGQLAEGRRWCRAVLAIATVPIAVLANALRVAGTGVAAHFIGAAAAEGFLHAFSGWLVFIAATLLLFATHRALGLLSPGFPDQILEAV